MPIAQVRVDADRCAHLTIGDREQKFPDLGAAMSELARQARDGNCEIRATVSDAATERTLSFDATGRLRPVNPKPVTPPPGGAGTVRETSAEVPAPNPGPPGAVTSGTTDEPESTPPAPAEPARSAAVTAVTAPDQSFELRDRYSGPLNTGPRNTGSAKTGTRRTVKRPASRQTSLPARSVRSATKSAKRGFTVPGIVLAILLVGVIAAYFVPTFIGSPDTGTPQSIDAPGSQNPNGVKSRQDSPTPVPGFGNRPAWEHKVPAGASVTASDRGVLVVDGKNLQILDPNTGDIRYEGSVDGTIEFAVDTVISNQKALVWRVGDRAYALFDGQQSVVTYALPADARMSSAGSSVLIKSGNELSTFGLVSIEKLPTPDPGLTPMALDSDTLISAEFSGPLVLTDVSTGDSRRVELEKPADDLHIIRWVSAGHGKVITLWGEPGASTNSGHRIQVVVSQVDTGKIASTVATTTDEVGEANWVRGQGYELATFGPYLFDMNDGLLIQDGTLDDVNFGEPRGHLATATVDGKPSFIDENVAYSSPAQLLAVGSDRSFAIVRTNPDTITGYKP